jgi:ABC-type glycerol-3-phosphate transport system permease component
MTTPQNAAPPQPAVRTPPRPAADAPPPKQASRSARWLARHRTNLWHLLLIPLCVVWVYPFIWVVSASFKSQREVLLGGLSLFPHKPTLDNFSRAWNTAKFAQYTGNTVTFSVTVVALVLLTSAMSPAGK